MRGQYCLTMNTDLQAGLDALNAADPPDMDLPFFVGQARHGCLRHRFSGPDHSLPVSSPLEVKEVYVLAWADDGAPVSQGDGETALVYKQGRCRRCGFTGRSHVGRLVEVAKRPPLSGRVSRG